MNTRILKLFLPALLFVCSGYYIYHPGEDLARPEVFWPAADGERPGPGRPMVPAVLLLDQKLAEKSLHVFAAEKSLLSWSSVPRATSQLLYGGTVTLVGNFTERLNVPDGKNTIELVNSGWFFGSSMVALTVLDYSPDTGKILEADIFLNGQHYSWGDRTREDVSADLQNIITHELGHVLGLGHSQYRLPTMSRTTRPSETRRRILREDDVQGIRRLYPAVETDIPGPSLWSLSKGTCQGNWYYMYGPAIADASTALSYFCLYGAGFEFGDFDIRLISQSTGEVYSPVANTYFVTGNLLILEIDLSQLEVDSYRMELQNNGMDASLRQALLVKQGGRTLPAAKIAPVSALVQPGQPLTLDGSSSISYSGAGLNYHWFVAESTADLGLGSTTDPALTIQPALAGDYVIGLMVDDGVDFSLIAESLVSAAEPSTDDTADEKGGCGCQMAGASPGPSLVLGFAPVLLLVLLRARQRLGRKF